MKTTNDLPAVATPVPAPRRSRVPPAADTMLAVAASSAGAGMALVVALDGSLPWRLARLGVVTAAAVAYLQARTDVDPDRIGAVGMSMGGEEAIGFTYTLTDVLTSARPPATLRHSVARAAPRPVLLIAAGAVEEERLAGDYVRQGAPASVELWVVPGAGHTDGLRTAPDEWEARVTAFLDANLSRNP